MNSIYIQFICLLLFLVSEFASGLNDGQAPLKDSEVFVPQNNRTEAMDVGETAKKVPVPQGVMQDTDMFTRNASDYLLREPYCGIFEWGGKNNTPMERCFGCFLSPMRFSGPSMANIPIKNINHDTDLGNVENIPFRALECFLEQLFMLNDSSAALSSINDLVNIIDSSGQFLGGSPVQPDAITTTKLLEFIDATYNTVSKDLACSKSRLVSLNDLPLNFMVDLLILAEDKIKPRIFRQNFIELRLKYRKEFLSMLGAGAREFLLPQITDVEDAKDCQSAGDENGSECHDSGHNHDTDASHGRLAITIGQNMALLPIDTVSTSEVLSLLRPSSTKQEMKFRATLYSMFIFDGIESSNSFYELLPWEGLIQIIAYVMFDISMKKWGSLTHYAHLEETLANLAGNKVVIGSRSTNPFTFEQFKRTFYPDQAMIPLEGFIQSDHIESSGTKSMFNVSYPFYSRFFIQVLSCYFFVLRKNQEDPESEKGQSTDTLPQRLFGMGHQEFFSLSPLDQATVIIRDFASLEVYLEMDSLQLMKILEYVFDLDPSGASFGDITKTLLDLHMATKSHIFRPFPKSSIVKIKNFLLSKTSATEVANFLGFLVSDDELQAPDCDKGVEPPSTNCCDDLCTSTAVDLPIDKNALVKDASDEAGNN